MSWPRRKEEPAGLIRPRYVPPEEIREAAEEGLYRLWRTPQEEELLARLQELERKRGGIYRGRKGEELAELAEEGEEFYK